MLILVIGYDENNILKIIKMDGSKWSSEFDIFGCDKSERLRKMSVSVKIEKNKNVNYHLIMKSNRQYGKTVPCFPA